MPLVTWLAIAVVALWVFLSGGSPVVKCILYRALFVCYVVGCVMATMAVYGWVGLGPALLTSIGLFIVWAMLIGPMVAMLMNLRKNPKQLASQH